MLRAAIFLIVAHVLWSVVAYAGIFGGDPEIHIVFARNLLRGYPLQFTPGRFSSGETSPVYMLVVAAMAAMLGPAVPLGMKLSSTLALAALCILTGREARRAGASPEFAVVLGALPLLLPSMLFQASLGMENMLFACLVVLTLRCWLAGEGRAIIACAGVPLLFFLRPEAALVGLCLAVLAALERDGRSFFFLMSGAAVTVAGLTAITLATGATLEAPGLIRAAFTRLDIVPLSIWGVPVWLNIEFAPLLLYCLPFALVGWRGRRSWGAARAEAAIFAILFCLPLLLHLLTVFPSTHFSRYFLYGFGVFFFLFARLAGRAERAARAGVVAAIGLLSITLVPYEHRLRAGLNDSTVAWAIERATPGFIRANSDALYDALGRPPVPVVIALDEVQVRASLDDRFVVRPLDGVVDDRFMAHVHGRSVDYGGYLAERKVAFLLSPLPDGSGVCLKRRALSPVPPAGYPEAFAVIAPRGC
jgi:hypothetical protein